jgi:hypothetical protein
MSRFRCVVLAGLPLLLAALTAGCSPYSSVAKIGIKVIGDVVNDADVDKHSKQLIGQPPSMADVEFGPPIRTLEEVNSGRLMMTYPVKEDLLKKFRWTVEVENGRIVALAKLQSDPDGGKDIIKKALMKEKAIGKTAKELQQDSHFQKLTLTLRDRATGNMIRVYDVSGLTDFLGAKSCVLEFGASGAAETIWIVGVPAASDNSSIKS